MNRELIDLYIGRVLRLAELPKDREAEVREEISGHLTETAEKLMKTGLYAKDATWKAIEQYGHPRVVGSRLRRPWQWVDIRQHGTARGFIAIGPKAVGVFAFGGFAAGIFAVGGTSIALFGVGGFTIGLLLAWGGLAIGGTAFGGLAAGIAAGGGVTFGVVAYGGSCYALLSPITSSSAAIHSYYTLATAPEWLKSLLPLLEVPRMMVRQMWIIMPTFLALTLVPSIAMTVLSRHQSKPSTENPENWLLE